MERLLVESAIRSVLIALGVAGVLWVARMKAPAVRHAMWTVVVLAMLSLPLWTTWGPKAEMPMWPAPMVSLASMPSPSSDATAAQPGKVASPGSRVEPIGATAGRPWRWQTIAVVLYAVVAAALFLRLAIGTLRARRLVRQSIIREGRLTSGACASPVTLGWLRPVVILPEAWRDWPCARLDAVLTHEQAHVSRRDPLVQWLALLNRAIFWFHPLAWWLERRLSALAEQTCDEAVLARGHDPQAYSEYLIDAARAVGRGRRVHLSGAFMPGTCLSERLTRILDGTPIARVSRVRVACTVAACALALTAGAIATPVRAASQRAGQSSRLIIRPVQPRWISPDSTAQPVSLDWLDGDEWAFEVQSIITSEEMLAYSELRAAPERDAFIDGFWARRDPSPGTPANELREEFSRRVQFARQTLADPQSHGIPGFDTDRGRVYLMFGQPDAIETQKTGTDRTEVWRYDDVAGLGSNFSVRFSSIRGPYCGFRIVSPAPVARVEAVDTSSNNTRMPHTSIQFYPMGLAAVSVSVDAATVVGARWELRSSKGIQVDEGSIGFLDGPLTRGTLAEHLSRAWLDVGLGCTYALPADLYTLTTGVRLVSGRVLSERVTFRVE